MDEWVSPIGETAEDVSARHAAESAEYRAYEERLQPYREVAEQVILLRTRTGMSQEDLARRVGTSKSAIARLESGRHPTTVKTLRRVAGAFGVRLSISFEHLDKPEGSPEAMAV